MKSMNYVVIQGWMCNELELKGNELLIFAMIYGFSQDEETVFYGSRTYMAETFNISLPTVDKALCSLEDKNLIERTLVDDAKTGRHYEYNVCKETLQKVVKKLYGGSKETLHGGSKETLLNNTSKQTDKIKKNNSKELLQTSNFTFGKQKTKSKKENMYTKCSALIYSKTDDKEIQKLLFDWFNMLLERFKDRGRSLYVNVFMAKLNMLDKYDRKDWKEIIEYNLQRGYEGFYPINNYTKSKDKRADENMVHVPSMTEEDYKREERELAELKKKGVRTTF